MKILKEGRINNQELADWFGISLKSLTNTKKKKLEELKLFAEFYEDKGKIIITKVINDTYTKQGSKAYQMVKDKVDEFWSDDGLDSCKNVSTQIVEYYGDELPVNENTTYQYTRRGRNELYGVPFIGGGSLGNCIYTWCKKEEGKLVPLSDEEQKLKEFLIKKYFGDASEKQILVAGMVEAGELDEKDAWKVLTELTNMKGSNFMSFLQELQTKIGCQVVRGTLVTRNAGMIEEKSAF